MRILRCTMLALAVLIAVPVTMSLHAQGIPDLPPAALHLLTQVPADTAIVAPPVVLPTACASAAICVKAFVLGNQLAIVTLLSSLVLYIIAHISAGFAAANDWLVRVIHFAVAGAFSLLVSLWGGAPDPGLQALISGGLTAVIGGTIFKMGKTQPGN